MNQCQIENKPVKVFNFKMLNKGKYKYLHRSRAVQNQNRAAKTRNYSEQSFKSTKEKYHASPGIRLSGLIPTTTIKINLKPRKQKPIAVIPMDVPSPTSSKFPYRRPKSIREPRNFIPFIKKKYSSSSQLSQALNGVELLPVHIKKRTTTSFQMNRDEQQKIDFVRYSYKEHLKTQYIEIKPKESI